MYAHILSYISSAARLAALLTLLCLGVVQEGYGQRAMERVYASSQANDGLLGSVTDAEKAHDEDIFTHSTMSVTVLGSVYQELIFLNDIEANTPVRVKIGTGTNLLGLLKNISIQAYNGSSPVGPSQQLNSLITLLSGTDQAEVIIVPPDNYDRVRISTGGVALGSGLNIYEAYYYQPATGVSCDQPVDILYGSSGNLASGLSIVENPGLAIDGDITTAAVLNATLNLANKTHLTTLYSSLSDVGDSVRIIFRSPGGLLQASLLSTNFSISTYNDNQNNGALALEQSILNLSLLPGSSDIQVLTYPVNTPFNRVEVSLGNGLLEALSSIEIYEIQRITLAPEIIAPNITEGVVNECENRQVTLSVANPINGYEYRWYTAPEGGSPFTTGTSYTTPPLVFGATYTYYISASPTGCVDESIRTKVVINVLPEPGKPHLTITDIKN